MDWDKYRFILQIGRDKTLSEAARSLNVNQTTVSRKLASLENEMGASLFMRTSSGLVPTDLGKSLIHRSELMESQALKMMGERSTSTGDPKGEVRIATMNWIFAFAIVPRLSKFSLKYPGITLQAVSGVRDRPLANREAELALRFEINAGKNEISLPIMKCPYSLYIKKGINPDNAPWCGFHDDYIEVAPQNWLEKNTKSSEPTTFLANDAGIIYQAIKAGMGKGLIPDTLAQNDPDLQRLSGSEPEICRELKLLVQKDMASIARVEAVISWLREQLN